MLECRLTIHEKPHAKPDYHEVTRRMALVGYERSFLDLHGMYRKRLHLGNVAEESRKIKDALTSLLFDFSFELFEVRHLETYDSRHKSLLSEVYSLAHEAHRR